MEDFQPDQKPLFGEELENGLGYCDSEIKGKELEFELADYDLAELGKAAARLQVEIVELEAKFENAKQDWKDRIGGRKNELREKLRILHSGKQVKTVDCVMRKNFTENKVQFLFDGVVVEERAMESEERQAEMPLTKEVILRKSEDLADDRMEINRAFSQGSSQEKDAADERLAEEINALESAPCSEPVA